MSLSDLPRSVRPWYTHWAIRGGSFLLLLTVPALATLWPYLKQSNKALQYRVTSVSPLGVSQAAGFKDLRLMKGDRVVESPYLATVKVSNSGDVAITEADFASPITIKPSLSLFKKFFLSDLASRAGSEKLPYTFGPGAFDMSRAPTFIDARIAGASPSNIPAKLKVLTDSVEILPVLLNPGDTVLVELLVSGGTPAFGVDARIAGVKAVEEEQSPRNWLPRFRAGSLFLVACFMLLVAWVARQLSRAETVVAAPRWLVTSIYWGSAAFAGVLIAQIGEMLEFGLAGTMGVLVALLGITAVLTMLVMASLKDVQRKER